MTGERQVKWLTYLVYLLLTFLGFTFSSTYSQVVAMQESIHKEYVQKERYLCDMADIKSSLDRIEKKLDAHIASQPRAEVGKVWIVENEG